MVIRGNNVKKKILYITNIPSPYRVNFFNELGRFVELTVLFEKAFSKSREKEWHQNNFENFKAYFLSAKKKMHTWKKLNEHMSKEKYDFIVVGGYSTPIGMLSILLLKYRKIPFILNADGGFINNKERLIYKEVKKFFISSADFYLSSSRKTNGYLEYYGANSNTIYNYPFTSVYKKDILHLPTTIEEKHFLKEKLSINEEKVVIAVGKFIYSKGFDLLLKAANELPSNVGIYIIGGDVTKTYLSEINGNDLKNIHFIEFLNKESLNEYYKISDVFVLPTRSDVWGLVINEAMAKALPIITTDKCGAGIELIVDYENGFIIPDNNSELLAEKILEILENSLLKEYIEKENLKKINDYSIENMALITLEIFSEIKNRNEK